MPPRILCWLAPIDSRDLSNCQGAWRMPAIYRKSYAENEINKSYFLDDNPTQPYPLSILEQTRRTNCQQCFPEHPASPASHLRRSTSFRTKGPHFSSLESAYLTGRSGFSHKSVDVLLLGVSRCSFQLTQIEIQSVNEATQCHSTSEASRHPPQ